MGRHKNKYCGTSKREWVDFIGKSSKNDVNIESKKLQEFYLKN